MRLCIDLPRDRNRTGVLRAIDGKGKTVFGPVPVAGRASDLLAAAHRNPGRDPLFRFGDTPLGQYRLLRVLDRGSRAFLRSNDLGSAALALAATSGPAAIAEANGRYHVLVCGGPLSADGRLRSTAGAMRLRDEDAIALGRLLARAGRVTCSVSVGAASGSGLVSIDDRCPMSDPVTLPAEPAPAHAPHALAQGMVFGVAVSFAAAAVPAAAATATSSRPSAQVPADPAILEVPPALVPKFQTDFGPGPVKLAYNGAVGQSFSDVEVSSAVTGTQEVSPQDYGSQMQEIWSKADVKEEVAGQTVDTMKDLAEEMAAKGAEEAFKPEVTAMEAADIEFKVASANIAASALEGVSTALAVKTSWEKGTMVGHAVNDLIDGKMGVSEFAQKVGPVPAELLLSSGALGFSVPYADQVVETGIATINYGLDKAMDAGFSLYDKWKGYNVQRSPKQ